MTKKPLVVSSLHNLCLKTCRQEINAKLDVYVCSTIALDPVCCVSCSAAWYAYPMVCADTPWHGPIIPLGYAYTAGNYTYVWRSLRRSILGNS